MSLHQGAAGLTPTRRTARIACALVTLLTAALTAAGCGDDPAGGAVAAEPDTATLECPDHFGDGNEAQIEVQWQGPWDEVAAPALIATWDEGFDGVSVMVPPTRLYGETVSQLLGDGPPTVARVPLDAVEALAASGAIRPLDPCLTDALHDTVADAGSIGVIGRERYGIAGNVGVSVLVYDHGALTSAGLLDDGVPTRWQRFVDVASSLRKQDLFTTPVVDAVDPRNLTGPEIAAEVPSGMRAWDQLAEEGLLLTTGRDDDMLPVGGGAAAFEVVDEGRLWAYGSALGQGQAPEADVRVAAIPSDDGPAVQVSADVWVISAQATEGEAAAATAFLSWLVQPAQQAALHRLTDLFPTSLAAADDRAAVEYWSELPLLGEVWDLLEQHGVAPPEWSTAPGAVHAVEVARRRSMGGDDLEGLWATVVAAVDTIDEVPTQELLSCVFPAHGPPVPATECSVPDS